MATRTEAICGDCTQFLDRDKTIGRETFDFHICGLDEVQRVIFNGAIPDWCPLARRFLGHQE